MAIDSRGRAVITLLHIQEALG